MPRTTIPKMLVQDLKSGDYRRVSWYNPGTQKSEKLWSPVVIISRGPLSTVHYAVHPERDQTQKFVTHNDMLVQGMPASNTGRNQFERRLATDKFQSLNQGRPVLKFEERQ